MSEVLRTHPAIDQPADKELHYFDTVHASSSPLHKRQAFMADLLERNDASVRERIGNTCDSENELERKARHFISTPIDDAWYCGNFSRRDSAWPIDITPAYSVLPDEAFKHMRRMSRDTRIIFILRDPVDRIWSQIRYMQREDRDFRSSLLSEKVKNPGEDEFLNLARLPGVMKRTDYCRTLSAILRVFPRDSVTIRFYDSIVEDPESLLRELLEFLGIQEYDFPVSVERSVNQTAGGYVPESVSTALREEYGDMVARLSRDFCEVPDSWKERYGVP